MFKVGDKSKSVIADRDDMHALVADDVALATLPFCYPEEACWLEYPVFILKLYLKGCVLRGPVCP